jgi:multiple sugar transport system ATP-binding protein
MTLGDRIVVMNGGEILQIDAPMRLYEKPANVFVAGFLGSPAMNFFRGGVDGGRVTLGDRGDLIVGVRPEDLVLAADTDADAIEATLEVVEPVGNEMFLNLRRGDQEIVMRVPPQAMPKTGTTLRLAMKSDRVHLFDSKTERRIES